uniref:Uncharacterized protein n=1 Tax=Anguilla anguilla TaxID=7936 RepID=A0A0E9USN9_ANGAN
MICEVKFPLICGGCPSSACMVHGH